MKGDWCTYLQGICQEGECSRCEAYLHRNDVLPEGGQDTRRAIALEDLTGIRKSVTVRRKQRSRFHSWAYAGRFIMRIMILSNSPAYPATGSGYANIVKNLSWELSKLGYDIAITGMQTSYEMGNIGKIPIYPLLPDFHAVDSLNMQLRQLSMNMKHHGSDILLCIFQGDSKWYNPFTQIVPDKTVWFMPLEGEIIYKNHQVWNDARKVKKVVAMTNSAGEQFKKQGISCETIYLGYNPKVFHKGYNKNLQESIIIYFPANNEELILPACKLPEWKEKMGIECMFGFNAQNFGVKKRIERLIEAYSIFAKDKKDVHLHLHTLPVGVKGLNLLEIINHYDIKDKVTFSYGNFGSSGWSEHALNILYNQFDIYVSASSGEGFCLAPDTLILTNNGIKKIKDIEPGNRVLSHKGKFRSVEKVTNRYYKGDLLKITPYKIPIPVAITPEHRVLAVKTMPCANPYLKSQNRICRPNLKCYYNKDGNTVKWCQHADGHEPHTAYSLEWIPAQELKVGDCVVIPKPKQYKGKDNLNINIMNYSHRNGLKLNLRLQDDKISMNNSYSNIHAKINNEIKLTPEVFRLFGYFIAEGTITGDHQISFCFNVKEIEYIEDVKNIMQSVFSISPECKVSKNSCELRYSNRVLQQFFLSLFCDINIFNTTKNKGRKARCVSIPYKYLNSSKIRLVELIKGMWRGDGGEGPKDYTITTTSETLAYQIEYILTKFNILATLTKTESRYYNKAYGCKYIIKIIGDSIKTFDRVLGIKHKSYYNNVSVQSAQYWEDKDYFYITIKEIEKIQYDGEVYNLEVKDDNSYTTSFVVHNCLPILESAAVGIPQIHPDFAPFNEFLGYDDNKRGLLAKCIKQFTSAGEERALVDIHSLAEKMEIMYAQDDFREMLGRNAQKWASEYTWSRCAAQFDKVFRSM